MKHDHKTSVTPTLFLLAFCLSVSAVSCAPASEKLSEAKAPPSITASEGPIRSSQQTQVPEPKSVLDPQDEATKEEAITLISARMEAIQRENPSRYSKIECYDFNFFQNEKAVEAAHFIVNMDFRESVKTGESYLYIVALVEGYYSDEYMKNTGLDGAFQGPTLAAFLMGLGSSGGLEIVAENIPLKLGMKYPHESKGP